MRKTFHYSKRIGEEPIKEYYENFKNLKRSVERKEHLKEAQTMFLTECEEKRIAPRPFGIVQYKGREEEINIRSYMIGNDYAQAYGKSL